MAYSFDKIIYDEDTKEILEIPKLTGNIIYCPKCGSINTFEDDSMSLMKNCFCERCGVRINDFWDKYDEGELALINCEFCAKVTFLNQKFCIQCGAKQQKVSSKRLKQLQKSTRKVDLLDLGDKVFTPETRGFLIDVNNKIVLTIIISVILFAIIISVVLMMNFIGNM